MEQVGYFTQIWHGFWAATPIEQIGFLLSLGLTSIFGWVAALFGFHSSQRRINNLIDEVSALKSERDKAERSMTKLASELDNWKPSSWLKEANKERKQGNEERAIAALEGGLERLRIDLSEVAIDVSGYRLSLIVGHNAMEDMQESERLAKLAKLLNPANLVAQALLEEIVLLRGNTQEILSSDFRFLPSSQEEAAPLMEALISAGAEFLVFGHPNVSLRLFRRCTLVALRSGLAQSENGFEASYFTARTLLDLGNDSSAMDVVTSALPDMKTFLGEESRIFLSMKFVEANILSFQGDDLSALKIVNQLVESQVRVFGPDNAQTLSAKFLQARVTSSLQGHERGLPLIQALLPDHSRILGNKNYNVLASRHLELQNLMDAGISEGLLDQLNQLIKDYDEVLGSLSPHSIPTRSIKAQHLAHNHKHAEANVELDSLLIDARQIWGESHPQFIGLQKIIVVNRTKQ